MSQAVKWTCGKCTFINESALDKCEMCDGPRKKSTPAPTVCPKCGSSLDGDNENCVKCEILKGISGSLTLDNIPVKKVAGLTLKLKPGPSKTPCDLQCRVCMFINRPEQNSCERCGSELAGGKPGKRMPIGTVRYKHPLRNQRTVLGEELRRTENKMSLELWNNIREFCKEVNDFQKKQLKKFLKIQCLY